MTDADIAKIIEAGETCCEQTLLEHALVAGGYSKAEMSAKVTSGAVGVTMEEPGNKPTDEPCWAFVLLIKVKEGDEFLKGIMVPKSVVGSHERAVEFMHATLEKMCSCMKGASPVGIKTVPAKAKPGFGAPVVQIEIKMEPAGSPCWN